MLKMTMKRAKTVVDSLPSEMATRQKTKPMAEPITSRVMITTAGNSMELSGDQEEVDDDVC